jgi:hypothetical protein
MTDNSKSVLKYCYWMDEETLSALRVLIQKKGLGMIRARQNPCEVLREEIGFAEPDTWSLICKHDAAPWYHQSEHAGKILVVSSFPLDDEFSRFHETTIELTSFEPTHIPSQDEIISLAQDKEYLSLEPDGWGKFPEEMKEAIVNGLSQLLGVSPGYFSDLLCTWTACHSNFANPKFRADETFSNAPYSIADSSHISSCCVELFNLLGSKEKSLLVRPCIGAVIVKALEKDRYYLVGLTD